MAGNQCFIGLGSNIGDGPAIIQKALEALADDSAIDSVQVSSLYTTAAWGRPDQADFTNAVARLQTRLSAIDLLKKLLQLEKELGRSRDSGHWGPRLIDLDLLTFGNERIHLPGLVVPHPHMHERAFVLVPLLELEPEFEIPGLGKAREWQEKLMEQVVRRLA